MKLLEYIENLEDALHQIANWSEAYPLDIFPEPDFKKARALLEAGGITLDAVAASCMRHVIKGVGLIAKNALECKSVKSPQSSEASPESRNPDPGGEG